jgi:hypothetical protein
MVAGVPMTRRMATSIGGSTSAYLESGCNHSSAPVASWNARRWNRPMRRLGSSVDTSGSTRTRISYGPQPGTGLQHGAKV